MKAPKPATADVQGFANKAAAAEKDGAKALTLALGPIVNHERVNDVTGVDLSGHQRIVDDYAVHEAKA